MVARRWLPAVTDGFRRLKRSVMTFRVVRPIRGKSRAILRTAVNLETSGSGLLQVGDESGLSSGATHNKKMIYNEFYEVWEENVEIYESWGYNDGYRVESSSCMIDGTKAEQEAYWKGYDKGFYARIEAES